MGGTDLTYTLEKWLHRMNKNRQIGLDNVRIPINYMQIPIESIFCTSCTYLHTIINQVLICTLQRLVFFMLA